MSENPKVAIVILTWNKKDYVIELLKSIRDIDYDNYDLILVDNASTDGTSEAVTEQFPYVHIIKNSENLGGTGGFNTGMKYALGKGTYNYLWLLDNDVIVDKSALSELIKVLESSNEIAIAGSAMYNLNNKGELLELGYFVDLPKGAFNDNKSMIRESHEEREFYIVDSVSSCSLCVSTKAIQDIGIWDEAFFIYCDDVDWNIRFGQKGYKTACVVNSLIWHVPWLFKFGFNTVYYANRNMMYLMSKHLPLPKRIIYLLYKELSIIMLSLKMLRSGEYYHSIIALKSLIDFFDRKFSKFKDDDYLRKLDGNIHRPYQQWSINFLQLLINNITYTTSVFSSIIQRTAVEWTRLLFQRLPFETRLRFIDKINNHYLSKRVKCRRSQG